MIALLYQYYTIIKKSGSMGAQLLYGSWKLAPIKGPTVAILGGARLIAISYYLRQVHDIAGMFAMHGISTITGGGPGVMQAGNCGALHGQQINKRSYSIGITIKGLNEEPLNVCSQEKIIVSSLFVRKWLIMHYAQAFIFFPGGFGTLDELAGIIALVKLRQIPGVPIVLFGKNYWDPLMDWFRNSLFKQGLISEQDLRLIAITDNIDEAFRMLRDYCQSC